jgi:endoglucanase
VLPVYEYSPDAGSSWFYASVAARAARLLKRYDAKLAATYEDSARKAMTWAEVDFARQCKEKGKTTADLDWVIRDTRNLAALEMLRLTGDRHWHDVFLENTVLTSENPSIYAWQKAFQGDAAFAYATAAEKLTEPTLRRRAVQALEQQAKTAAAYADGNAFDIVCQDKWRPMFMGFYSTPWDGNVVLRAYHLTGKPEYLIAGIRAAQFSSGANPENLVFTTGLGSNPIQHPLLLDQRRSGQPAPEGITVYGIDDMVSPKDWILPAIDAVMSPKFMKWPRTESYTDTYIFVMLNEFTIDQTFTQPTWTWGYLAARPATSGSSATGIGK